MADEKGEFNFEAVPGAAVQVSFGGSSYLVCTNSGHKGYQKRHEDERWTKFGDGVAHVAVGDDGEMWYCDEDQNIFRKHFDDEEFEQIPGRCLQIDVGNKNEIVCINEDGNLYKYNGEGWDDLPGNAVQVSVGSDGDTWCVNQAGKIWQYSYRDGHWNAMPGRGSQVAVGDAGNILAISKNGSVYRWNGDGWDKCDGIEGTPQYISTSSSCCTFVSDEGSKLFVHHEGRGGWEQLPGEAKSVHVGCADHIICINGDGIVCRYNGEDWEELGDTPAIDADIGDDGTIWMLNEGMKAARWDEDHWENDASGGNNLTQIYVANDELMLGIRKNSLYKYVDNRWRNLKNTGDIRTAAVGSDGEIWYIKKDYTIYRLNDDGEEFEKYPGKGVHISVGDEDSILMTNVPKHCMRKDTPGMEKGNNGKWWERCVELDGIGPSLNIGSDGTMVKIEDGGIWACYGEPEADESEEEPEPEEEEEDEVGMGRARAKRRRPRNAAARRRLVIARAQRKVRRSRKAAGESRPKPTRAGYKSRKARRQLRRGRRG